ncbi:MAG TPA: polysaccharide deacetylase family protein [Streptosporangiaceae bacterium]|nr:polysaccharide deacetylase family protein [Streptosporangiaceae bacterium]
MLTRPAARAGQVTRWLSRSTHRAGSLAAAGFLAAGVLTTAGPLPAASAAAVPPGLGGQNWTAIPTGAKVVALTFDAGANAAGVQSSLGTLAKYHVTATFMLTGDFARAFPAASKAIAAAGYRIGDHSVSHPSFTALTDAQMRDQVLAAQSQIKSVTGTDPWPWFRFPYGDYSARAVSVVNGAGFVPVGWTVDTLGWEGTSGGITAQTVLNRVLGSLRPGEIVLMHCGSNPDDQSTLDAAALPSVIQALQARGYSFVTLDALRAPGTWGDMVNRFGNGFDVYRQRQAVNAVIAGWTAAKADPATHFIRVPGTVKGAYRFDYAPNGVPTGLSVSEPGYDAAGTGLTDGLVLRASNTGPWQQFIPQPNGTLKNAATGHYVNPNDTGAQLRGGTAPSPWGGSVYTWTDYAHLPG